MPQQAASAAQHDRAALVTESGAAAKAAVLDTSSTAAATINIFMSVSR